MSTVTALLVALLVLLAGIAAGIFLAVAFKTRLMDWFWKRN